MNEVKTAEVLVEVEDEGGACRLEKRSVRSFGETDSFSVTECLCSPGTFAVTHTRTGSAAAKGFKSPVSARACALELEKLGDWRFDDPSEAAGIDVKKAHEITRRHGGDGGAA